ncbi:MAG TPA: hypothetical protein VIK53_00205 [Verrucomicrobiae bacterium]
MKIRRLIMIAGLLVAVAALASVALVFHWQHSQMFKGLAKLAAAEQSYLRDHVSRGEPSTASVTLRDLVSGGYISTDDARAFDGMDVTFYPTVGDSDPQAILVRVQMRDGVQIALMADGSIAQLPYQSPK